MRRRDRTPLALAIGGAADFAALATTATTPIVYYPGILVGAFAATSAVVLARSAATVVVPGLLVAATSLWTLHHADDLMAGFHPLRQNWATNAEYRTIVDRLPLDAAVWSPGEIGALAFYCQERGCTVVDPFLADPGRVAVAVARWRVERRWADLNYARYDPPSPVATRYRIDFVFPARPLAPDEVAVTGGMWQPGIARVIVAPPDTTNILRQR